MINLLQATAITIIGGADGPTSIYVTSKLALIIPLVIVILLAFAIYKLISWYLKKQIKESEKILQENKTEEERKKALSNLKKKNIKRVIISSIAYFVGLPILIIAIMVFTRTCSTKQFPQAAKQFARLSSKYSVYPEIWYQYGSCCMETGDYDTAIRLGFTADVKHILLNYATYSV